MGKSTITWTTAVEQADWIRPRLGRFDEHIVASVVPSGFAAYARVLHPVVASGLDGEPNVRWGEVADWAGTAVTRQAQFPEIAVPEQRPQRAAPFDGDPPLEGSLSADDAAVLTALLSAHTETPDRCWFCLWDGYGWQSLASAPTSESVASACWMELPDDAQPAMYPGPWPALVPAGPVPGWVLNGPRVSLPHRDYLLYTGAVPDALALLEGQQQTPNLWWPEDRSWCVASEIDLAWTYIGGPVDLIEAVLCDQRLEALEARLEDSIAFRPPAWIAELVTSSATEVLEHGTTTLSTAWGTVRAQLQRRRPGRGWLSVQQNGGESGTAVGKISDAQLYREICRRLGDGVLHSAYDAIGD